MRKQILVLLPVLLNTILPHPSVAQVPHSWNVYSPDHSLQIVLLEESGKLLYQVVSGKTVIVQPSTLGLVCEHERFSDALRFVKESSGHVRETYEMKIGKRKSNLAMANETSVVFKNALDALITIDLRAYNDGVAFRYRIDEGGKPMTVIHESTAFVIHGGTKWLQNYDMPSSYTPAYESDYLDGIPVGTPARNESGWAFPVLFHTEGHWLLLTESNVDGNYCGSHLEQSCENGQYRIAMPLQGEAQGKGQSTVTVQGPLETPWRVIITGQSLGTIVESNLVYHLANHSQIADDGWVKPGRASWSWWSDHPSSRDFEKLKTYVDLASDMGWEYSLVDANWNRMENGGKIEDLVQYARSKKIGLSFWYNSGGPHNIVTEQPRDIMNDPVKRREELKKLQDWGVKAVKVDFFQSDKQDIMKLYLDILKDAADHQIMVVFHGCTIPRGWSRTYPNLVSMEAVKGAEQYGWDSVFARQAAKLNVILAYTRNVVGPMDYTPVTFSDYPCCAHATTNAHELALSVIFESGILHFADNANSYKSQDPRTREFLGSVPSAWDDTKFIRGEPGKDIVLARRKGNDWYLAGLNGDDHSKAFTIDLSFLGNGSYKSVLFSDGDEPRKISIREKTESKSDELSIRLLAKGGFVMRISPSK